MGCTACKEESNMNQAPNTQHQRRIAQLEGIKRIGSPGGSFATKPTPSPSKKRTKDGDEVKNGATDGSPKMVLVESVSEPQFAATQANTTDKDNNP